MALGTFIAGPYSSTYNYQAAGAADLGITEKGYQVNVQHSAENVAPTDIYGDSVIDQVHRGANVTLEFTTIEWKASPLRALQPWSATVFAPTGATALLMGVVGGLGSAFDGILILTAVAGTTAATAPATMTATHAIIHEGFDVNWLMGPNLKKIPLKFRILPFLSSTVRWFSAT